MVFGLFKRVSRKPRRVYMVIDGDKKEYIYVDGKYIPRDRVISVDVNSRKIVYIDYDGKVKVSNIDGSVDVGQVPKRQDWISLGIC